MASIFRNSLLDGFRLARTVGRNLKDRTHYTTEEMIAAAEDAARKYPGEWVVFFVLCDKYQEVGRYVDSISAGKRMIELRPDNIVSVYALATAYNMLTRAWFSELQADAGNRLLRETGFDNIDKMDPVQARAELAKAGLTAETAAAQAIRYFERALTLRPDRESREQIHQDLKALNKRFPGLR